MLKFIFLIIFSFIISRTVFSQEGYRRFSLGAGTGITTNSSDLSGADTKTMIWGTADFYLTKYIQAGLEAEEGKLAGKDKFTNRYFQNDYKSLALLGKVHLGQLLSGNRRAYRYNDESFLGNLVKGIYLGSGGGLLISTQKKIQRVPVSPAYEYAYRGQNNNKELFIPGTAGIDWFSGKQARLIISIQYQVNFVLGDNMDGYLVPGSKNDLYSTAGVGFKYAFGRLRSF